MRILGETMYQRILVPLDEEDVAAPHVPHAAALAAHVGAEVILLRVITVVQSEDYFMQRIQVEEGSRGARQQAAAEKYVARLAQQLRGQGVAVQPMVIVSDQAEDEAILAVAAESHADLIVLPRQQRSLLGRWLKGNVAARVQRRSPLPVLFVAPDSPARPGLPAG